MRTPIVAGNWKMNTTVGEALDLVAQMRQQLEETLAVEAVLCPPFVSLAPLAHELASSRIKIGAQNAFWEEKGAFTGEISSLMLAPLCDYVIIGHSERRQYFSETDETVNRRLKAVLQHGLRPIFCVGENLSEREDGRTSDVIIGQVRHGLRDIPTLDPFVIAYEPVWAIGTGRAATGAMANDVIALIRRTLSDLYGEQQAAAVRIQYGGSVTADNVAEFVAQPDIDGALVGGASLRADQFVSIVQVTASTRGG